jgi:outer membrane protein assembly factor BamB
LAAHPDWIVCCEGAKLNALDRRRFCSEKQVIDRKGNKDVVKSLAPPKWSVDLPHAADGALIVAGDQAVVGGAGNVCRVDLNRHRVVWTAEVDGLAAGLAVADARLYVSTDRGAIYCFDKPRAAGPVA